MADHIIPWHNDEIFHDAIEYYPLHNYLPISNAGRLSKEDRKDLTVNSNAWDLMQ